MVTKEQAREELKRLVEKYNKLVESGRVKSYNEEMTKKDFILPLFRVLGWNVEDGDEVTAEEKISKGRVDYAFRIEGIPKLFLEAKALREDLSRKEFAEQAINYAWHKGAVWAVLTDFEGVKVFNAEWKSANYLQNQFFSIHCNQFLGNFDQLWLLSRESLEQGLIDKEAEKWGKKAKKIPVDKQLLSDLTKFRELLIKNILKNNASKNLSEDELEEAVQRIIDRLIFIRTLEDKQLEAPILQSLIRENTSKRIYKKLDEVFRNIDDIYNSKLFTPHLCEEVVIDDDVLEKVIYGLFKTSDNTVHYDFSAIDADVLGNIYEQYLGHILKKTAKRASLTEGKAHRKEQGIYYTPTYVVDYIIKNTIGELAKDKKFDLKNIKVLDPACGSGSFLMKAFDYLLTLDKKKNGEIAQTKLDLTGASASYGRKVEILKENIFGVDLDPKAVEIAQLNLLLKTAEKKHRLPTLQENIKVGNSLIDDPAIAGDRAFKWEDEFKDVMKEGGFDVVIGNPPWVSLKGKQKSLDLSEKELNYLFNKYPCDRYRPNLFEIFMWRGLSLLKEGGYFSFIVPDRLCYNGQFINLRKNILNNFTLRNLWFKPLFAGVISDNVIFVIKKEKPSKRNFVQIAEYPSTDFKKIPQEIYASLSDFAWFIVNDKLFSIFEKIRNKPNVFELGKKFQTKVGFIAKPNKVFQHRQNDKQIRVFKGENILRFGVKNNYYFEFKKQNLAGGTQDIIKLSKKNKVFLRKTGIDIIASFDNSGTYPEQSVYFVYTDDDKSEEYLKVLCAMINSRLINCFYRNFAVTNRDATPQLKKVDLDRFPIILPIDKQPIIKLVDRILSLNKRLNEIKDKQTDEKTRLEKEIQKTDDEIDQEVCKIYGITKEEQKIIEESLR